VAGPGSCRERTVTQAGGRAPAAPDEAIRLTLKIAAANSRMKFHRRAGPRAGR
jgi:hypothetical protein